MCFRLTSCVYIQGLDLRIFCVNLGIHLILTLTLSGGTAIRYSVKNFIAYEHKDKKCFKIPEIHWLTNRPALKRKLFEGMIFKWAVHFLQALSSPFHNLSKSWVFRSFSVHFFLLIYCIQLERKCKNIFFQFTSYSLRTNLSTRTCLY